MKKYLLETVVFITGMGIMIFELVGSRVLAPYVGTTVMVWSALIGTILAFLSAGYWWGGRVADRKLSYNYLSGIIFMAALLVGITGYLKLPIINFLEAHMNSFRWESVWASFILFGPASFFMAAVSPFALRLKLASVKDSGTIAGKLYAISTVGSILGTFLTGMLLIPLMGSTKIIFLLSVSLIVCSVLVFSERRLLPKVGVAVLALLSFGLADKIDFKFLHGELIHTAYQDVRIVRQTLRLPDLNNNLVDRPVVQMVTGQNTVQSAMYADKDDDLIIPYTRSFRDLVNYINPNLKSVLVIGGAGYSVPKDLLRTHQDISVDVAEIDPKITDIAKEYFNLKDDPRLNIYAEDGRTYLNRNQKKYDVVFIDAFRSYVAPFQLTTEEAAQKISNSLNNNGVVIINIIQSIEGDTGRFFRGEYRTYQAVFPHVYAYRVIEEDTKSVQNILLVATKSDDGLKLTQEDESKPMLEQFWQGHIANDMPVITDDFAPVADYMLAASRAIKAN